MLIALMVLCTVGADPIVLTNGAIRVEVDPLLFSVRYVGSPGGANFVEPLYVPEEVRKGREWADPGGLTSDPIPYEARDAAIRRGPAEILERTAYSVAMLGPISEKLPVRLKKEVRIDPDEPRAFYAVSVVAVGPVPQPLAIRNTARVPPDTTLRIPRADGTIRPLAGTETLEPAVVETAHEWAIAVPPAQSLDSVVFGAFVPQVTFENRHGSWTRRLAVMPADASTVPQESTVVCLLDEKTSSYAVVLQGALVDVSPSSPAVFVEEWTIDKRP